MLISLQSTFTVESTVGQISHRSHQETQPASLTGKQSSSYLAKLQSGVWTGTRGNTR